MKFILDNLSKKYYLDGKIFHTSFFLKNKFAIWSNLNKFKKTYFQRNIKTLNILKSPNQKVLFFPCKQKRDYNLEKNLPNTVNLTERKNIFAKCFPNDLYVCTNNNSNDQKSGMVFNAL